MHISARIALVVGACLLSIVSPRTINAETPLSNLTNKQVIEAVTNSPTKNVVKMTRVITNTLVFEETEILIDDISYTVSVRKYIAEEGIPTNCEIAVVRPEGNLVNLMVMVDYGSDGVVDYGAQAMGTYNILPHINFKPTSRFEKNVDMATKALYQKAYQQTIERFRALLSQTKLETT